MKLIRKLQLKATGIVMDGLDRDLKEVTLNLLYM